MVVDYTSNSPEVAKLHDLSSTATISHMKSIMARHGLPSVVVSDNGPQFSSREFRQFAKQYGLKHVTHNYSPDYTQSNVKVFLVGRPQRVRRNNTTSSVKVVFTGSPQGCVLSPLLFILYTKKPAGASVRIGILLNSQMI